MRDTQYAQQGQADPTAKQQPERGSINVRKALDQYLTQRASIIPEDWREFAKNPVGQTVLAADTLEWLKSLDDKHYFFIEQLAVAFGESTKKDTILRLASDDDDFAAYALQVVLSDALGR